MLLLWFFLGVFRHVNTRAFGIRGGCHIDAPATPTQVLQVVETLIEGWQKGHVFAP